MAPVDCPNCGYQVENEDVRFCPSCGGSMGAGEVAAAGGQGGSSPPPSHENSVPFEDMSLPFAQRYFRTIGMAVSDPVTLFSRMDAVGIGAPLLFAVINGTVVAVFTIFWQMMFGGLAMLGGGMHADEFAVGTGLYILFMFLSPLFAVIGQFIGAAIYHVALMIFGDGQRGFAVTFRALAYGNSPNLLAVVPFCGGFIGGIWALVLVIIGGKHGHGTDWWRAILAYFLPAILCCCLAIWLAMTFGFIGALSQ